MVPYELILDKLCNLRAECKLGERMVYLRSLSDLDLEVRERAALLAGRRERQRLSDPKSDDYQSLLGFLDDLPEDDLRETLVALEGNAIWRTVVRDVAPTHVPLAEGTPEEQAVVLAERARERQATEEAKQREFEARVGLYRQSLVGKSQAELLAECKRQHVGYRVNLAYAREVMDQSLYRACFDDPEFTKPAFTLDQVRSLPRSVKVALRDILDEMDAIDIWSLKD